MELKQLEYFMVACEKGSFNQAAECLYTSQPNVSKVIGMLEQELGRALFERTSRGLRVTPYGETVREYAHNILNHVSLINSLAEDTQERKFTVSTYPSNMIARLLTDFYKKYFEGTKTNCVFIPTGKAVWRRLVIRYPRDFRSWGLCM